MGYNPLTKACVVIEYQSVINCRPFKSSYPLLAQFVFSIPAQGTLERVN